MPKVRRNGKITYITWNQYQTYLTRKIIGNNFTEYDVNKIYSYFYNESKEQIEQETKSWPDKNDEVYLIGQYIDFDYLNSLGIEKAIVEFLRVNHWIKKWFDIDYSKHTVKQSGYEHLPLQLLGR